MSQYKYKLKGSSTGTVHAKDIEEAEKRVLEKTGQKAVEIIEIKGARA
jgi:hypothetical protein